MDVQGGQEAEPPVRARADELPPDAKEFTQDKPPGQVYQLRVRKQADDFIDANIVP